MTQDQWMQLVAGVAVLILVLPTMMYVFRQQNALRNAAIWLAALAALMWGYHVVVEKPQLDALPATPTQDAPVPDTPASDSPVRNL